MQKRDIGTRRFKEKKI